MRLTLLTLAAAALLTTTGCSNLVSLNPLASDDQMIQNSALSGVWADDDNSLYIVRPADRAYEITYIEKKGMPIHFNAKLFRIGDAQILDLTPADDDPFRLNVHTPVRIWVDSATLRFTFLDSKWLREHAAKELPVQDNDRTLITAPAAALGQFLARYAADERAFENTPAMLHRQ